MGQASKKKQRIAAMRHLGAGPGEFLESTGAVVLLSRTDRDTLVRFRAAVRDLVPNPRLYALIDGIDRPTLDSAAWMLVAHVWDGWTTFKLIAKDEDALAFFLDELGEGFAARRMRWSTLVFGTERDVACLHTATQRFREDLPKTDALLPTPVMALSQEREPKLLIEITRADVEAMNLSPPLLVLDTFAVHGGMLDRMGGAVVLSFTGYDDDARFLGEIPGVHLYLRQLAIFAPWAPLVSHPSCFMLWCKPLDGRCTIQTQDGLTHIHFPEHEGGRLILDLLTYSAAELMSERLMTSGVHPRVRRSIEAWQQYLATGSVAGDNQNQNDEELEEVVAQTLQAREAPVRNEKEFWESLVTTLAPGWIADFQGGDDALPGLAGQRVIIYVLDTKTGWIVAAGLPIEDMQRLLVNVQQEPEMLERVPTLAIETIQRLGAKGAKVSEQDNRLAIVSAAAALASTKVLLQIIETCGSPAGQYLYMVYSPTQGEPLGRPVFIATDAAHFVPLEAVYGIAAEAIQTDIKNLTGHVGGHIRAHGGLVLCPYLQALVAESPSGPDHPQSVRPDADKK